jgi:hypothetical protein
LLKNGAGLGSPLARVVGSKCYHDEVFFMDHIPWNR